MKQPIRTAVALALLAGSASIEPAQAQERWTSSRPDGHAPIGVMGDHMHEKGEVMLSYRFMYMNMDGNRNGDQSMSTDEVFDYGYVVTPTSMPMQMHMFGFMWAPHDRLTMMFMGNYVSMSMDHQMRNGNTFSTESSAIGDTSVGAMFEIFNNSSQAFILNAGISLPTGSIGQMDATPASGGNDVQLPYPMQTGSGTYDLLPGLTYLGQKEGVSWGAQGRGWLRLGENARDYTLGDKALVTGWLARNFSNSVSASARVEYTAWGDVAGRDLALNPAMVSTADPSRRQGNRVDGLLGLNLSGTAGALTDHRLALELGFPLWQSLDGPQLETAWSLTVGWQYVLINH